MKYLLALLICLAGTACIAQHYEEPEPRHLIGKVKGNQVPLHAGLRFML